MQYKIQQGWGSYDGNVTTATNKTHTAATNKPTLMGSTP